MVVLEAVVFGSVVLGAVVFGAVGLSGGTLDCNRDVELEVMMAKFFSRTTYFTVALRAY